MVQIDMTRAKQKKSLKLKKKLRKKKDEISDLTILRPRKDPSLHNSTRSQSLANRSRKDPNCFVIHRHTIETVPSYLTENPHIKKYYRAHLSLSECVSSAFHVHNEMVNVWSHFLAAVFNWYLLANHIFSEEEHHFLVMAQLFFFGLCYFVSSVAHTFTPHSAELWDVLFIVDRMSIALFLSVSSLTIGVLQLECYPFLKMSYVVLLCIILIMAWRVSITNPITIPQKIRFSIVLIAPVAMSIPPLLWGLYDHSSHHLVDELQIWSFTSYGLGILAALFYATQFPERVCPGLFDFIPGHSIMHITASVSTFCAYRGSLVLETLRADAGCSFN